MKEVRLRLSFVKLAIVALAGVSILEGCSCGEDTVRKKPVWSCEAEERRPEVDDDPCPSGERFVKGECAPLRCDADPEAKNCCPGMLCTGGGECAVPSSRFQLCESDTVCDPGQRCLDRPRVTTESKTCGFVPTSDDGACPPGTQAFNHRCIVRAPCEGGCATGEVCNIDLNRCEALPVLANADSGCDQACGAQQVLVYSDPDAMLFDGCCEVQCECLDLPPLLPGAYGRYNDIVLDASDAIVSAYDSTYGDLVVARYAQTSGELVSLQYVDGVPTSGTPVANTSGPRGGIDAPGPDVGEHTAIALHAGAVYVAYYDLDNRDLRLAVQHPASGLWTTSVIDDGRDLTSGAASTTADVGRFTSLVIDGDGGLHVSYYAHRVGQDGAIISSAMYAHNKTPTPSGYADWDHVAVDPQGACNYACTAGQSCVQTASGPACRLTRTDCGTACACDQSCVDATGVATCLPTRPMGLDEPCNADCSDPAVCVADAALGTACRAERNDCAAACASGEVCVDDGAGAAVCRRATPYSSLVDLPRGSGLFTSLALVGDSPSLVYYDRLRKHLRAAVADFDVGQPVSTFTSLPLACDPANDQGQHASLAVRTGQLVVAFQADEGATLKAYRGADFLTGTVETIDDGVRAGGRLHLVGASASVELANDGTIFVAYADQTDNDLMLAWSETTGFSRTVVLDDGAQGGFARIALEGALAYLTSYQRERDGADRDVSRLVLTIVDTRNLP